MITTSIDALLQLRRDTLERWNSSDKILQPGELAVAYTTVETTTEDGETITIPTVMLKAGENIENSTKRFVDLPFVSAVASDVSAWAKQAGIRIKDEDAGAYIQDVEWVNDELVIHRVSTVGNKGIKVTTSSNADGTTSYAVVTNFDFAAATDSSTLQLVDKDTMEVIADFDMSAVAAPIWKRF